MGEESLGHMIKRRRETLGFSQARLGELVGRSASTIRNWERDKSTPSAVSDAVALAAVLGLSENRVVEAAGFQAGDVENRPTLEQSYASLAPTEGSAPDGEAVEDDPVPVEQAEPSGGRAPQTELSHPEEEMSRPAATASREAESEEDSPVSGPALESREAGPAEPDDTGGESSASPGEPGAGAESASVFPAAGRLLQAVFSNTGPADQDSSDEPSVSRAAPPTVLETPPPVEPSYLEDPDERQRYRARALATAAVVVFLLIVFLWSFDRTVDALGGMWDDFTGMLEL